LAFQGSLCQRLVVGCSTDEGQKALEPLVLPRIPAVTWHWIPAHQQNHMVSILFRDKLVINK